MNTTAEKAFAAQDDAFNYYPNAMIILANLAYNPVSPGFISQVNNYPNLEQTVVWGPAQILKEGEPDSVAYIVYRASAGEYTVVIRGTTLDSWDAWVTEDFDTHKTEPLSKLIPGAPADANVSQGTYNGMHDLQSLTSNGQTIVQYLQQVNPGFLYVTGHSLGGTLTPVMFAYLQSVLPRASMALWSFAGLTAGDSGFNSYLGTLLNNEFPWRNYNTLDVAPLCWWNEDGVKSIYSSNGVNPTDLEKGAIDLLFDRAAGNGYAQPAFGGVPLPGDFQTGLSFGDEAAYQHHSTTYIGLVQTAYPWPPLAGS